MIFSGEINDPTLHLLYWFGISPYIIDGLLIQNQSGSDIVHTKAFILG